MYLCICNYIYGTYLYVNFYILCLSLTIYACVFTNTSAAEQSDVYIYSCLCTHLGGRKVILFHNPQTNQSACSPEPSEAVHSCEPLFLVCYIHEPL